MMAFSHSQEGLGLSQAHFDLRGVKDISGERANRDSHTDMMMVMPLGPTAQI